MDYQHTFIAKVDSYLAQIKALGQEEVVCLGLVRLELKDREPEFYDKDATAVALFQDDAHSCWHRLVDIVPEPIQGRGRFTNYRNRHSFRAVFAFYNPTQRNNKFSPLERVYLAFKRMPFLEIERVNSDPLDVLDTEGIEVQVANGYYIFAIEYFAYLNIPFDACQPADDSDALIET